MNAPIYSLLNSWPASAAQMNSGGKIEACQSRRFVVNFIISSQNDIDEVDFLTKRLWESPMSIEPILYWSCRMGSVQLSSSMQHSDVGQKINKTINRESAKETLLEKLCQVIRTHHQLEFSLKQGTAKEKLEQGQVYVYEKKKPCKIASWIKKHKSVFLPLPIDLPVRVVLRSPCIGLPFLRRKLRQTATAKHTWPFHGSRHFPRRSFTWLTALQLSGSVRSVPPASQATTFRQVRFDRTLRTMTIRQLPQEMKEEEDFIYSTDSICLQGSPSLCLFWRVYPSARKKLKGSDLLLSSLPSAPRRTLQRLWAAQLRKIRTPLPSLFFSWVRKTWLDLTEYGVVDRCLLARRVCSVGEFRAKRTPPSVLHNRSRPGR